MPHNSSVALWVLGAWLVLGAILTPILGKFIAIGAREDLRAPEAANHAA